MKRDKPKVSGPHLARLARVQGARNASLDGRHESRRRPAARAALRFLLVLAFLFGRPVPSAYATSAYGPPSEAAHGNIVPLVDHERLAAPIKEEAVKLKHARVVLADYPLIKHDFGRVLEQRFRKPLGAISHDEIDAWLLESAGYISARHVEVAPVHGVNTAIPTEAKTITAWRPYGYNRALVYEPAPGVLIDVKGAGSLRPSNDEKGHHNGLATLGEAIREFAYEKLVREIFEHEGAGQRTVGTYAVIDAGFDVRWGNGHQDPAGLILRQAHDRAPGNANRFDQERTRAIELTLRKYGITSAGAEYGGYSRDQLNVQGTKDGAIVDFGAFLTMEGFTRDAKHYDGSPSAPTLISKEYQPDPAVRVPFGIWGYSDPHKPDPASDRPSAWSHELARALRKPEAIADPKLTRAWTEQHMHNLLAPVTRLLGRPPRW